MSIRKTPEFYERLLHIASCSLIFALSVLIVALAVASIVILFS